MTCEAPLASADDLSAEELAEARAYGRLELITDLADKLVDVAFLSIMAFLAVPFLREPMREAVASDTLRLVTYLLITVGLHLVVSFPLSYFSGHVLEHRFGLSNLSAGNWLLRYVKRNLLCLAFFVLMFVGLYWMIWTCGRWWWLMAAFAFFGVNVLLGQLVPLVILPLFYKIKKIDRPELSERLTRLAEGTGLSIEGVYQLDLSEETSKANAMLAGLGRTRRVLLGDTVLQQFSPEEIEVIFAHEIGHHVFRHIPKMIVASILYSMAGFWVCDQLVMAYARHWEPMVEHATLPTFTLPLVMLVLTSFSMLLEPVQNLISRQFERQCDRFALERTGLRSAYISAFRKLARLNKDDPHPPALEVFLFHSHPPISERLAIADHA